MKVKKDRKYICAEIELEIKFIPSIIYSLQPNRNFKIFETRKRTKLLRSSKSRFYTSNKYSFFVRFPI